MQFFCSIIAGNLRVSPKNCNFVSEFRKVIVMKKVFYFVGTIFFAICMHACGLLGGNNAGLTGDIYTASEVEVHQDNTTGGSLARAIYEEEVLKAQGGEADGKYSILREQTGDSLAAALAIVGAEIAKQRVLTENLVDGQSTYRVFYVQDQDSADFIVRVSVGSIFDNKVVASHGFRYYRMESVTYKQPDAVDLGLRVLWAAHNLGATTPEEFGGFYAWGETEQKEAYTWDNYRWGDGNSFTKYFNSTSSEVLEPADDAATVHLGGDWRTPTYFEMEELVNECLWTEEYINGVRGFRVMGPNGNSIFMPLAGVKNEIGINPFFGWYGNYQIANTNTGRLGTIWYLRFHGDGQFLFTGSADSGLSVRPVKNK